MRRQRRGDRASDRRGGLVLKTVFGHAGGVVGLVHQILGLHFEHVGLVVGRGLDIRGRVVTAAAAGRERGESGQGNSCGKNLHSHSPFKRGL